MIVNDINIKFLVVVAPPYIYQNGCYSIPIGALVITTGNSALGDRLSVSIVDFVTTHSLSSLLSTDIGS